MRLRGVYNTLDIDPPYELDSGMAIWTLLDEHVNSKIYCVNPATNDSKDLLLPSDGYPVEIGGHPTVNRPGNINPEVRDTPVRVIIKENAGGHLEGWIRTWTTDITEFKEESLFSDHTREERVEWDGSEQTLHPEKIKKRTSVFNEEDVRGSKNDLLDGHL
jgi:hypothetical protein